MRIHALSGLLLIGLVGCNIDLKDKGDEAGGSGSNPDPETSGTSGSSSKAGQSSGSGSGASGHDAGGSSSGASGGNAGEMSDGGGEGGDFTPSNVPVGAASNRDGELTLTGKCNVDGKAGTIECDDGKRTEFGYALGVQTGPDRADLAVFSVRNLTVAASAQVLIKGPYPVAFVAAETMSINGTILATVEASQKQAANAGGNDGVGEVAVGLGLGAGGSVDAGGKIGAGGGAFCGRGGAGLGPDGPGMNGGKPYGNATLTPLMGGSSGGSGGAGISGGGGGAIQLVAGVSLNVGLTGAVAAPGGGGGWVRTAAGGSGGAILLEAPTVRIAGMVSANGGGGAEGTGAEGERGRVDAQAAKGGSGTNPGGDGSSSTVADGGTGQMRTDNSYPGGSGGGGAGWIRINTATGKAEITGTLSPSVETSCASIGKSAT